MIVVTAVKLASEAGSCNGCKAQIDAKGSIPGSKVLVTRVSGVELRFCEACADAFAYAFVGALKSARGALSR